MKWNFYWSFNKQSKYSWARFSPKFVHKIEWAYIVQAFLSVTDDFVKNKTTQFF